MTVFSGGLSRRAFIASTVATGAASVGLSTPALAQAAPVNIISAIANSGTLAALRKIGADYQAATGIEVIINNMEHEAHKTAIRSYLTVSAPDICFWFSGNRMKAFVERGLFDDISDLFERENLAPVLGLTKNAVTIGERQYGLPLGGVLWGLWYRKDVFAENGWTPPATWPDFLALGEAAKSKGMVPLSMGTKDLWPTGGFFDHLSLRINSLDNHMALMDGKLGYTDPAVVSVFDKWGELVQAGMFPSDHASYNWEPAAAALVQKRAAMMDLGPFIRYAFPADALQQLAYAPFPEVVPGVARYEDFSLDSVHVPTNAANKQGARDFLAFFYKPENLAAFVAPEGVVPARSDCPPSGDALVNSAIAELKSVAGAAQYYDRDTHPDMAQEGMKGFQEFLTRPDRKEAILDRLERVRTRVFR